MEILIERKYKKPLYSIGLMYIDGKFFCNTLEDTDRNIKQEHPETYITAKKVYGKTAIPLGTYDVVMDYSAKFKKKLPHILNVKGFSGVRIHAGNKPEDTLGCILLGKNDRVGRVSNSGATCNKFYHLLNAAGGRARLTIR